MEDEVNNIQALCQSELRKKQHLPENTDPHLDRGVLDVIAGNPAPSSLLSQTVLV